MNFPDEGSIKTRGLGPAGLLVVGVFKMHLVVRRKKSKRPTKIPLMFAPAVSEFMYGIHGERSPRSELREHGARAQMF